EIPTSRDDNDNIVTYFVPDHMPKPGEEPRLGYTQWWYGDDQTRPPGGRVVSTRRDGGSIEGAARVVVDFAGGERGTLPPEAGPRGVVDGTGGDAQAEIQDQHVVANPHVKGWRLSFQVVPKKREPVELRAHLEHAGGVLTEIWSSAILP